MTSYRDTNPITQPTTTLADQLREVSESLEIARLYPIRHPHIGSSAVISAIDTARALLPSLILEVESMERELELSNQLRGPGTVREGRTPSNLTDRTVGEEEAISVMLEGREQYAKSVAYTQTAWEGMAAAYRSLLSNGYQITRKI